jgi:hypothetical protein
MRGISLEYERSVRVLFLNGGYLVKHVAVDDSNCYVILAITDIVFEIHGVGVGLHQHVVLPHCFVHLLTLTTVNHEHDQVSRQPLLYPVQLLLPEEVFRADV